MKYRQFLLVASLLLLLPFRVHAASPLPVDGSVDYGVSTPVDTDHDGLTDQGEQQVFGTNPTNADTDGDGALDGTEVVLGTDPLNAASSPLTATTIQKAATPYPWAWTLTRAAGVASYLLLSVLAITGILLTTGLLFRIFEPSTAWSVHRAIATTLLFSVAVHIGAILFDNFIKLRVVDVLIPFVSPYRPLLIALGIGGMYLLLLLIISSLYTLTSHPRFWRTTHALSFPMFLVLFLHGILIGTDAKQLWMQEIYWSTGVLITAAVVYRLIWKYHRPAQAAQPLGK